MGFENHDFSYKETTSFYDFESLTSKDSIKEASKVERCEVSIDTLKSGIRISNERTIDSVKKILSDNNIFDLSHFQFKDATYEGKTKYVLKLSEDKSLIEFYYDDGIQTELKKIGDIQSGKNYNRNVNLNTTIERDTISNTKNLECKFNNNTEIEDVVVDSTPPLEAQTINTLNQKLENGVNIENETHYNQVTQFIESNYKIKMCDYADIDINQAGIKHYVPNVAFILKVDNINKQVVLYPPIAVNWSSRFGFIKGGKFEANMSWYPDRVNSAESIKFPEEKSTEYVSLNQSNLTDVKKDQKTRPINEQEKVAKMQTSGDNIINQNEEKNSISKNIEYTVQKGDKLWDIIQKYYNITDKRDTANIINKVVDFNMKHNPPSTDLEKQIIQDGIKGDKIHIGQKIILPGNITWRTKTFTLIQNSK